MPRPARRRPAAGVCRSAPRAQTLANTSVSAPACGSSAEWKRSAPVRACRHWKKQIASAPRATAWSESSRARSAVLGRLCGRHEVALTACSMSTHGRPPPSERMRSCTRAMSDDAVAEP